MTTQRLRQMARKQSGVALLLLLLIAASLGLFLFFRNADPGNEALRRSGNSQTALAEAKSALIGFAVMYRDTHPEQAFGYLPCPDVNNDGIADTPCGNTDVSVIGRLPWKTLGLPPLRDSDSECLWYAVSGRAKDSLKSATLNWDSPGQLLIQDASGKTLIGTTPHDRPLAAIIAPRAPLGGRYRTTASASECAGSNTPEDYLEMLDNHWANASHTGEIILRLANTESLDKGTNNDQGLWITSGEIFDRVKKRADFKEDIDGLLNDLANYLNSFSPANLPTASPVNKGIGTLIRKYFDDTTSPPTRKTRVLDNWQNNLLYAGGPGGHFTLNGSSTTCRAILFFAGARTQQTAAPLLAQTRGTVADTANPAMYLEGSNAARFPANGAYTGAVEFLASSPGNDIVRCINGLGSEAADFSNPEDFALFTPAGVGGHADNSNPTTPTLSLSDAGGSGGGCFWFARPIPLAGNILRSYYEFTYLHADGSALGEALSDRGNGFTVQMVRSDLESPPGTCGSETNMGTLPAADMWGSFSFIIETDVHKDSARSDPIENHTAITLNGSLNHASGTLSKACNGSTSGCRHSPANAFEESPTPTVHRQRIEIHSGCNSSCTSCTPKNHGGTNAYARISVWVDCTDCHDVLIDLPRSPQTPTIQRCTKLSSPEMDSIYFGFTGGFRSGSPANSAPAQGVTLRNFSLRSDRGE